MDPTEKRPRDQLGGLETERPGAPPASTRRLSRRRLARHDGRSQHLDEPLRSLGDALRAVTQGDFTVRLPTDGDGLLGEISLAFNALVERNDGLVRELDRLDRAVGIEGKTAERAS